MKILIVEDNDLLRSNLFSYFELQGHTPEWHESYEWAVYKIITEWYDAVVLDLWLWSDEWDGLDICREVRAKGNTTPILMLTARTVTAQKIEGLDSWADDYITKPFDYHELMARVKAMVRRDHSVKWQELHYKDITIFPEEMKVIQNEVEVQLSKLEFNLLLFFVQNQGRIHTKEEIVERVWGEIDMFKESRTLDVYVSYLRKKLWKDIVETVRWTGYIMSS